MIHCFSFWIFENRHRENRGAVDQKMEHFFAVTAITAMFTRSAAVPFMEYTKWNGTIGVISITDNT